MSQSDDFPSTLKEDIGDDVVIHDTKDPDAVFITTRSKIELTLRKYKEGVRSRTAWSKPVVLLLTLLSVILVADFSHTFGLSADVWSAIYIVLSLLSIGWLLKTLWFLYANWDNAKVEYVIKELESENITQAGTEE